jgi:hypothetical protein
MHRIRMTRTIRIHVDAPAPPAWGEPCNGCGVCCLAEPCPVGVLVSRSRRGACAALHWDKAARRYVCGVLARAESLRAQRWHPFGAVLRALAARFIAAGKGCDCDLRADAD